MSLLSRLSRNRDSNSTRTCDATGLTLKRATGEVVHRVAKPSYGPLNPPVRESGSDRAEWGRFDVVHRQTVYGGEPEECAYAESLAAFRVAADLREAKAGDLFGGSRRDSRRSVLELIEDEWQTSSHMGPGKMPADWREVRNLYRVSLPTEGWFVDIAHSETVTALNVALPGLLTQAGSRSRSNALMKGVVEWPSVM